MRRLLDARRLHSKLTGSDRGMNTGDRVGSHRTAHLQPICAEQTYRRRRRRPRLDRLVANGGFPSRRVRRTRAEHLNATRSSCAVCKNAGRPILRKGGRSIRNGLTVVVAAHINQRLGASAFLLTAQAYRLRSRGVSAIALSLDAFDNLTWCQVGLDDIRLNT